MNGLMKKAGLGIALAATALTAAAPADAQRWGRGYRGGGWGGYHHRGGGNVAGAAVLGGILGLGVGAAIARSNRDRYVDRGYYNGGYYDGPPVRTYYRQDYRPRCWSEWRVDPYYGDQVQVQVCS
ncbi:hypothetical protein [Sphingomonas sp. TWP1-3-1]|uniref:hypothetical protein n=1 Tax=Sphingomonas sp. TWP1-3-1 TaxID=2804612 RepID=UPI003CF59841